MNPEKLGGLGWIDHALQRIGRTRKISIFTRHYQMPALLAMNNDLVATLPSRVARMQAQNERLLIKAAAVRYPRVRAENGLVARCCTTTLAHRWLRRLIQEEAEQNSGGGPIATSYAR